MSFEEEFLESLRWGEDQWALLEIVRRHFGGAGLRAGEDAYEALQRLWRDLRFDESGHDSPVRDELAHVMERVWYFGTNAY